jgi:signal peptidase I
MYVISSNKECQKEWNILNHWFVVHDLAYNQHSDMIGNRVKIPKTQQPRSAAFAEIKKGDLVVYYAAKDYVVVGIFEVVSDIEYLPNDQHWKEIMVFRIKPVELPPLGNYLDFRKFIKDSRVCLDLMPEKDNWGRYLQGKTCVLLSDKDYSVIESAISQNKYLKRIDEIKVSDTRWHKKYARSKVEEPEIRDATLHQKVIQKWKKDEDQKFGGFIKPQIKTNTVDLNEILPQDIWLNENRKFMDASARLDIGGQPFYLSILEVQHKGSKEDLCVRVSIILPFVTRVDIVSDESALPQIKELLERIGDPNIVKSRVRFYSFREFLGSIPFERVDR